MRYEVVLAPEAARAYRSLPAYRRAEVRDALERHLRHEPTRVSKSRIKRLRGLTESGSKWPPNAAGSILLGAAAQGARLGGIGHSPDG